MFRCELAGATSIYRLPLPQGNYRNRPSRFDAEIDPRIQYTPTHNCAKQKRTLDEVLQYLSRPQREMSFRLQK